MLNNGISRQERTSMIKNPLSTIVVADPDPAYQREMVSLLQANFRCVVTGSLREAYYTILREHPTILILELDQPDGDGIAFIQHLQADIALQSILIACVTRRASVMDKVRAFRVGADDYIVKPLPPATFCGQMLLLRRTGHMARNYSKR
jgi:DNA-binding response OmpR family regulator